MWLHCEWRPECASASFLTLFSWILVNVYVWTQVANKWTMFIECPHKSAKTGEKTLKTPSLNKILSEDQEYLDHYPL